jgi:signal transduction histidine kinase
MTLSRKQLQAYATAVGAVVAVTSLRLVLKHFAGTEPAFLLFLGAVMAAAWVGGTGPGLVATGLGALAGNFFFTPPHFRFGWEHTSHKIELVLFLLEGAFIAWLAGKLHAARDAALAGQAETRALQEELLRVSDDERRRIGHDLHDGLGQQLTGISLLGKALAQQLQTRQAPEADSALQIADRAREMIRQARELARGLEPVPVQPEGLIGALTELCETSSNILPTQCVFDTNVSTLTRGPREATHLYRIAQEAIHNAVKHAQAGTIRLSLFDDGRETALSVENDGKPFCPARAGMTTGGMGLRIMRHRASMIGGELTIGSTDGGHTILTCRVPHVSGEPDDANHDDGSPDQS